MIVVPASQVQKRRHGKVQRSPEITQVIVVGSVSKPGLCNFRPCSCNHVALKPHFTEERTDRE